MRDMYIKPETKVFAITQRECMMQASPVGGTPNSGQNGDAGTFSKGSSFFNDDDQLLWEE